MKRYPLISVLILLLSSFSWGIQSPDEFLGFRLGSDGNLAHYRQILEYFVYVGQESARVTTFVIGKTTLNNEMVMAVTSSPENIQNLDKYKEISRKLSQGEVEFSEAQQLSRQGKAIVFVTCNIHSDEIGSSQMSMKLLFNLATENSSETLDILSNVIFVLVPSVNPDGQMMVVDWYRKNKGSRYEGGDLPYLYHPYAGHDNNRDWYKLNLKETRIITDQLYFEWFPQILVDEHQMGSSGDRFYIPPFQDPPTPAVHPLVWRTINLVGTGISFDLGKRGFKGVASRGFFTGWWIGALDDTGWFHNIPGILFEAASVRVASPVFIEAEEIRSGESNINEQRMFSPDPWDGGWWRLNDIIDYDFHATLSVLKTASLYREELLMNSYQMALDSIRKGKTDPPFAYIIPEKQWDSLTAKKFVKTVMDSNIDIFQLSGSLQTDGRIFYPGSFVVPLSQPYRSFVESLFSIQHYPDLRRNSSEQPILPYDSAGWTLHLGMGIDVNKISHPFQADMIPVDRKTVYSGTIPETVSEFIVLDTRLNNSYLAAAHLLKKGFTVWRNREWEKYPRGTFLVQGMDARNVLEKLNQNSPIMVQNEDRIPIEKFKKLKNFRIALYQDFIHNMVEGWTRLVFDEFQIPYETVHAKDFLKKDFLNRFDVLVFVGTHKRTIESGLPPKEWERWFSPLPPEFSTGIEKKGEELLIKFLESGKTMIFMGDSCDYAIEKFKLPVINVKENNKKIICPGSYLRAQVKESELTWGLNKEVAVFYEEDPVFRTFLPKNSHESRKTPLVFGSRDLLLSGWLDGEGYLIKKSLVVDYKRGKGRIILIGPDVIHRTHSEGTYKIMFNALFSAAH